jgi:hypothetical protein
VKIDFDHFDKDRTLVLSIVEWCVVDADWRNLDLTEALPYAIRRGPIATCDGPVHVEGFLLSPTEPRRPVEEIAACLADGDARGDDPGR